MRHSNDDAGKAISEAFSDGPTKDIPLPPKELRSDKKTSASITVDDSELNSFMKTLPQYEVDDEGNVSILYKKFTIKV